MKRVHEFVNSIELQQQQQLTVAKTQTSTTTGQAIAEALTFDRTKNQMVPSHTLFCQPHHIIHTSCFSQPEFQHSAVKSQGISIMGSDILCTHNAWNVLANTACDTELEHQASDLETSSMAVALAQQKDGADTPAHKQNTWETHKPHVPKKI